ncbi:hypothetical protein MKW98_013028 [Papaver atlanticum]|uniref:Uncharacterized protein n=1 Tax=Papaver atlanticum TaxID=357466 RepID=A0AAD4SKB4_9MAGN|nr:hypothetical protein MKW98_013028 [Papaver atlanticum]
MKSDFNEFNKPREEIVGSCKDQRKGTKQVRTQAVFIDHLGLFRLPQHNLSMLIISMGNFRIPIHNTSWRRHGRNCSSVCSVSSICLLLGGKSQKIRVLRQLVSYSLILKYKQ